MKLSLSGSVIEGSIMLFYSPAIILNGDIKGAVKIGGPMFYIFDSLFVKVYERVAIFTVTFNVTTVVIAPSKSVMFII